MKEKIIIGVQDSKISHYQAEHLRSLLTDIHADAEFRYVEDPKDALISEEIDVAVHSLNDLPIKLAKELVIAALAERNDPSDLLIVKASAANGKPPLRLRDSASIAVNTIRRKSQITELIKNVNVEELDYTFNSAIRDLDDQAQDAIILASADIHRSKIDLSGFHVIRLNPKEFVPSPSQGITAYLCRSTDIPCRKILDQIHDRELAKCSNVERKVLKLAKDEYASSIGVYCEKDVQGNYHVYASLARNGSNDVKRVQFSQNTHSNLAEKVHEALNKN